MHGLTRVRGMTQDDSHSYVTPEQAPAEIKHLLDFCLSLFRDFGLDDFYLELSTRDDSKPDKFVGSDEEWEVATKVLSDVATESGLELVPDPGGAAYYGPKISVQARDAIGRTWQMSTIQYDFNQPRGFELEYVAADGSRQRPVMIHSAKFGSIERFLGVLVEHYAGAFPPWLAPVQVRGDPGGRAPPGLPLRDRRRRCAGSGLRVEIDSSDERMQKKIRNAQLEKVPFMMLVGDRDLEAGAVSFRYRNGEQENGVPVDEAIARVAGRGRRAASRSEARVSDRVDDRRQATHQQDGVGEPGRARAAVDPAPDGLHLRGEQAVRRHRRDVPVLPDPGDGRRGGADRAPRRAVLRRCSTSTPTPRATSWSAPTATSRATPT